ncbi:hypothetical protein C8R45DRAFT_928990 [Mycena sanguinolenta]|nr:hypothetical protein C8R45DRAFT_928990 [Mycena sanguinolenta]
MHQPALHAKNVTFGTTDTVSKHNTKYYVPDARSRYEHCCGQNQAQARLSDGIRQTGLCSTGITPSGLRAGTLQISSLGYRPAFKSSMERLWSIHRAQRCPKQGLKVTIVLEEQVSKGDVALVEESIKCDNNTRKPVSRLSEQTGLPSRQTGLQADLPGLGFDLQPNPSPSPKKPVGAGASPFGKPKTSLSRREGQRHQSAPHSPPPWIASWLVDYTCFTDGRKILPTGIVLDLGTAVQLPFCNINFGMTNSQYDNTIICVVYDAPVNNIIILIKAGIPKVLGPGLALCERAPEATRTDV